jgi:hypothetical protein
MRYLALLVLSISILLSCKKLPQQDLIDHTLVVGDSIKVKINRLDVKIETRETYNIDVNSDGFNDFALSCFSYYYSDPNKGATNWTWSVKTLSDDSKVLCDTISLSNLPGYKKALSDNSKVLCDTLSLSEESFFFAPKPLFIKDTFSADVGLWLTSTDLFENPGSFPSYVIADPSFEFFLFWYAEYYNPPPGPGEAKGGIPWEEFMKINEKYIGIQSEKNGIVTMGWIRLKHNNSEVILTEIGTADFLTE